MILWTTSLTDITFSEYNQQDAAFHNLFISVGRSTCFRRVFHPSSGAQNCTYSIRYLSDQYCYLLLAWLARLAAGRKYLTLYVQFWAPDDVERPTEINKLWNTASCWLHSANILVMHRPMNVKMIYTSLLITVAGVIETSVFKVPPQMRSAHIGFSVLPTFVAHGIMSQSSLQALGPTVPTPDDTAFCPCVFPERVNACVRLFTERQHTWIYMWTKLIPGLHTTSIIANLC